MRRLTPLQAIKKYCKESCCAMDLKSWKYCTVENCALYPYRMGKRPETIQKLNYVQKQADSYEFLSKKDESERPRHYENL